MCGGGGGGGGRDSEVSPLHMNHPKVIQLVQQDITSVINCTCSCFNILHAFQLVLYVGMMKVVFSFRMYVFRITG